MSADLSTAEVAGRLGVSTTTVRDWIAAGALPAHRGLRGAIRIAAADVARVLRYRPAQVKCPVCGRMFFPKGSRRVCCSKTCTDRNNDALRRRWDRTKGVRRWSDDPEYRERTKDRQRAYRAAKRRPS